MSNEELVLAIKNGNTALYIDLWKQLYGFIYKTVSGFCACHLSSVKAAGQTLEDLIQWCYIAMYDAVQGFEISKDCAFTTYFTYHIKTALKAALGIRTDKRDGLLYAKSLDEPLDDENGGDTLGDIIPDPAAEFESDIINSLYHTHLQQSLLEIFSEMPEPIRKVMQLKLMGLSCKDIADDLGMDFKKAFAIEERAMRLVRSHKYCERIKVLLDDIGDEYKGTGYTAFKNTQQSSVERIVEQRERIIQNIKKI